MNKTCTVAALCLIGWAWGRSDPGRTTEAFHSGAGGVGLSVRQVGPGSPNVRMYFTNASTSAFQVRRGDLPWIQRNLFAVAVCRSTHAALPITYELASAPVGDLVLAPSSAMQKEIDLEGWFPTLGKVLESDDVILFWFYEFRPLQPSIRQKMYGGTTLSQRR
jgi:hypothetical protein